MPLVEPLSVCEESEVLAEQWVSSTLAHLRELREKASERLRAMFGVTYTIDEMAVMFTSPAHALRWISSAVRVPAVTLFNSATDVVQTSPIVSTYNVHYWFLTTPDLPETDPRWEYSTPWRVEAMYAHAGSPLHDTYRRMMKGRETLAIHASFKCPDEEAYGVAVKTLRDNGYEAAQFCESTYGRFSYWSEAEGGGEVYLKPRLNVRDEEDDSE
jgi:hypothetical protein